MPHCMLAENDADRINADLEAKRVETERERAIRIEAWRRLAASGFPMR
jgi:hypothetical protein